MPWITCVTLDDIGSQILGFTASHQGKFLLVQSLHKLPFGLFWYPLPRRHPVNFLDFISQDFWTCTSSLCSKCQEDWGHSNTRCWSLGEGDGKQLFSSRFLQATCHLTGVKATPENVASLRVCYPHSFIHSFTQHSLLSTNYRPLLLPCLDRIRKRREERGKHNCTKTFLTSFLANSSPEQHGTSILKYPKASSRNNVWRRLFPLGHCLKSTLG